MDALMVWDGWMDGWEDVFGPSSASAPPSQLRMCRLNAIFTILVRLCGGEKKGGGTFKFQGQLLICHEQRVLKGKCAKGLEIRTRWNQGLG
jgi:hypothetical protein